MATPDRPAPKYRDLSVDVLDREIAAFIDDRKLTDNDLCVVIMRCMAELHRRGRYSLETYLERARPFSYIFCDSLNRDRHPLNAQDSKGDK